MNTEGRGVLCTSVHTHTTFCDGADTPPAMAAAAAEMGLQTLGFSGHGYVPQENFGIPPERMGDYCEEIRRLREMYAGRLEILCGLELDTQTPPSQREEAARLDYRIGSCHAVQDAAGRFWTVDDTPELLRQGIREGFGGDPLALVRAYYDQFVPWVCDLRPDIVGHLDLVTKFNQKEPLFAEEDPRYRALALGAADALLEAGLLLEVNTGAISRGWRTEPYPAEFLLRRIQEKGGRVTVTSDAHAAAALTFDFADALSLLWEVGFRSVWELTAGGWVERGIQAN